MKVLQTHRVHSVKLWPYLKCVKYYHSSSSDSGHWPIIVRHRFDRCAFNQQDVLARTVMSPPCYCSLCCVGMYLHLRNNKQNGGTKFARWELLPSITSYLGHASKFALGCNRRMNNAQIQRVSCRVCS
jgi:hypothetical protein